MMESHADPHTARVIRAAFAYRRARQGSNRKSPPDPAIFVELCDSLDALTMQLIGGDGIREPLRK